MPGAAQAAPAGPRLVIDAPRMSGSIGLTGAVFDDVVLKDYRETLAKDLPLVQLLGRRGSAKPSYAQFGWTPVGNIKVPTDATVWTASGNSLTPQSPITLSWDNGAGLTFQLLVSVDDHYMFTVRQQVINHSGAPVQLFPWSRVVRDYKPTEQSSYILFEGPLGVFNNTLHQQSYNSIKNGGEHSPGGQAFSETSPGGWIGITDKYWLTALAPAQQTPSLTGSMSYGTRYGWRRQRLSDLVHRHVAARHCARRDRQPADASVHRRQGGEAAGCVWARIPYSEPR